MKTICIIGETKGLFGEVEDNAIALYLTAPEIVNNNICWLIQKLENSDFVIIGNTRVIKYYTVLFNWIGGLLQRKISWKSVNIDNVKLDLESKVASENLSDENKKVYKDLLTKQYLQFKLHPPETNTIDFQFNFSCIIYRRNQLKQEKRNEKKIRK